MNLAAWLLAATAVPTAAFVEEWVKFERHVPVHNSSTSSWNKGARLEQGQAVKLTVALRLDDHRRAELEKIFWAVSSPMHPQYGKHLSLEEVTELLAVPDEQVERVRSYFVSAGALDTTVSPNRDVISVTMPGPAAETALNTRLHVFTHKRHIRASLVRASSHYALPASIAKDVVMVGELLQFPRLRMRSLAGVNGSGSWPNACAAPSCSGLVTPAVLAQRYKLPTTFTAGKNNGMAVAEFQDQYFKPTDIAAFSQSCHRNVTVDSIIGGNQPSAGVEAELDIEYIKSVAPGVPLTVVYNSEYSLLSWANQITSLQNPPQVHSVSYGNDEAQQSGATYMYTCNTAFMKAGVRGLSILFASGDQGVCGREGCGIFSFHFHPDFPAGSPYITAVGGTNFEGSTIGPEEAWSASGGGFSDTFPIPDYQKDAVAAYKASPDAQLPPQKYWNASGRGYPDVAALGGTKTPYCVNSNGMFSGVAGTSASCPVVAGVFALLNGLRLAAGKPPLGFLNPFIYSNPSGFQDVASGTNNNGRKYGFTAVKGWDAATGFGTPDYEALSKLVIASGSHADLLVV